MQTHTPERRRYPRLRTDIPVVMTHNRQRVSAYTYDLSSNGISLYIEKPLKLFVIYDILLYLPDSNGESKTLSFQAVTVRSSKADGNGHGYLVSLFMFCIGNKERKELQQFLEKQIYGKSKAPSFLPGSRALKPQLQHHSLRPLKLKASPVLYTNHR